ncbi:hypothetical protein COU37_01275 [Candidatus Micrarchaeota archaeon CG10_big_fil_rev_8_21_14_0_10_45_29]|nr:MAG: hypothetical protein COU37_01275 [Candidatus Micrarchaeota archaeon CG10_big_fil_rev_8_21_14_0_10_45_29]
MYFSKSNEISVSCNHANALQKLARKTMAKEKRLERAEKRKEIKNSADAWKLQKKHDKYVIKKLKEFDEIDKAYYKARQALYNIGVSESDYDIAIAPYKKKCTELAAEIANIPEVEKSIETIKARKENLEIRQESWRGLFDDYRLAEFRALGWAVGLTGIILGGCNRLTGVMGEVGYRALYIGIGVIGIKGLKTIFRYGAGYAYSLRIANIGKKLDAYDEAKKIVKNY